MFHQHAFHLKRANQVARRLDDIVRATDKPVVTVGITPRQVARQVQVAIKALAVARLVVQVAAKHAGPAAFERQFAFHIGGVDDAHAGRLTLGFQVFHDAGFHAWQRPAHGAGFDVKSGGVGNHDAAGFGLPPVVMNRQAQHLLAPPHGFGVERFAHAGHKAQGRSRVALGQLRPGLHQHANGGGGGVPDADALFFQQRVPALGIKLFAVNQGRDALQQRGDDAVRRAGDPAGVGRAPVAVLRVQVQRVTPG